MEIRMALAQQHRLRVGRFSEVGRPYLVTVACHDRRRVFGSLEAGRCFARAVGAMGLDAETWCWVAMPDHVHWLMAPVGNLDLSRCVQKLKALTTRKLRASLGWEGEVWQRGFHDRAVREDEDLRTMARYVIANPVRAGLVGSVRDWPFWDAVWI
jgi:REP element-mobilizing transposase RayT